MTPDYAMILLRRHYHYLRFASHDILHYYYYISLFSCLADAIIEPQHIFAFERRLNTPLLSPLSAIFAPLPLMHFAH